MKSQQENLITKSSLKQRGWTESLIKKYLPEPDKIKPNPNYRSAPPMRLYSLEKVEDIEGSEGFLKDLEIVELRKQSSRKSVATKLTRTIDYVKNNVNPEVPLIEKEVLIELACDHFNERNLDRDNSFFASKHSDEKFLKRIIVNYLRHELTRYEEYLFGFYGRVGSQDVYQIIKDKVLDAIGQKYPWLKNECLRQKVWLRGDGSPAET